MLSQDHHEGAVDAPDEHGEDDGVGRVVVPEPRTTSATRLLEMTARDTDRWREDARAEAAQVVADAREKADALLRTAQRQADGLVETAERDAHRILAEARAEADEVRTETDRQRSAGEAEVARLQQVAADHSHQLRQHLNDVLDSLEGGPAPQGLRRRDDS